MSKITVTAKDEFRSYTPGYTACFDFEKTNTYYMIGVNGCGKSTLLSAIRGTLNSNKDAKTKWGAAGKCKEITEHFDVTIEGIDKIYYLDIDGLDNPTEMHNASSAEDFIDFGGFAMRRLSAGERALTMLSKLAGEVEDSETSVVVFDELDSHFDFETRLRLYKIIDKKLPKSKKIFVTHDILFATINPGYIMEFLAPRLGENNYQTKLILKPIIIPDADGKKLKMFEIFTGYTINESTINESTINKSTINKSENKNG